MYYIVTVYVCGVCACSQVSADGLFPNGTEKCKPGILNTGLCIGKRGQLGCLKGGPVGHVKGGVIQ